MNRVIVFFRKFFVFVKRGFLVFISYKIQLVLSIVSVFFSLISFYFMVNFLDLQTFNPKLSSMGGNYLSFLVIGTIYVGLMSVGQSSFAETISEEQSLGTLEQLFVSKTPLWQILVFSSIWNYLITIINMVLSIVIYNLFFNVKLNANILTSVVILVVSSIAMMGIGMLSAGFIMRYKRGDPISWILGLLTGLLSGIYYPVDILPSYLQALSKILPPTYAISALRKATLLHATLADVSQELLILCIFALVTITCGLLFFQYSFNQARKEGSLSWY
ncbi:MAG: ABC transporter permease [Caldisericia bacterium]|nr:ABC transporter permease [Caldisericia bacterium]